MHHFWQGKPTRQAHKGIPKGHFEEEQGHLGFFGPVSHLIRSKPSTRWKSIEGPLGPHLYDFVKLSPAPGWKRLFYNNDITISYAHYEKSSGPELTSFRNADGDTLMFCHKGHGRILSEYGQLDFRPGHYLILPKGLGFTVFADEACEFFVVENLTSHFHEPDRGIAGRNALYDDQAIGKPDLDQQMEFLKQHHLKVNRIDVKRLNESTVFSYEDCIYQDIIGWKGDLYPISLHMDHIMPLMSHRSHLPPSAHTTFVARNFVVCSFLPRPLEEDDDALKVPFYHQNIDYDEVLFYHDGDFFSRDNLHAGMATLHPAGFPHGPHPKAIEKVKDKKRTDESAVMIDTRWPLKVDTAALQVEVQDYWKSWQK